MRKQFLMLPLLLCVACSTAPKKPAEEAAKPVAKHEITPAEMQAAMEKISKIGPDHHRLDPLVGKYTVSSKFWMQPGENPETATGTAEFKWILNGHYLTQDYKSTFQGQPYAGLGLMGFNNASGKYQTTWSDTMGTEIMMSEGQASPDGSSIEFGGEFFCPMINGPMKTREVFTIGNDRHTFEMYHMAFDGSGEFKAMELVYDRVKAGKKAAKKK